VISATAGDVLQAHAMRKIGDLGELRKSHGIGTVVARVLKSGPFMLGLLCMAIAFFALLFALSWADVSLVAPASASLTFISNAAAARLFLPEKVDRNRWFAALFVAAGVALLAM
jgi:drug/metabolite transporter (DMT)-like permease